MNIQAMTAGIIAAWASDINRPGKGEIQRRAMWARGVMRFMPNLYERGGGRKYLEAQGLQVPDRQPGGPVRKALTKNQLKTLRKKRRGK